MSEGGASATSAAAEIAVVGLGASAGGLEAFRSLFAALPSDTGMAFVVVQHLSPEHPSMLAKTLTRLTTMPVLEVADGMRLEPDRVYVMPSNVEVTVADGALRLGPRPASPGGHLPIDLLFRSLAAERRARAIGVVLSGTGEDGTEGLKHIRAEGGITFAQDAASAQFGGMPASAAAAGVVDQVLPPDRIAVELARLSKDPYVTERVEAPGDPALLEREEVGRILRLVRKRSGVDYSVYKPTTVSRRISRRMALHRIGSITEYGGLVERDPAEAKALSEDLLIHVTGFFRDPEVFAALRRTAFPALLAQRREGPIRLWVPGCSSGEEAYSLAMCLLEHLGESSQDVEFQIFGSDLSARAVERARAGLYPESALRDLGAERLGRFFTRAGSEHRIVKSIRDRCIFVVHDLTRDPPFAKLDLISCRNVLIYFGEELHDRLFSMFHYCLNRPGFLLIGRSESVTRRSDLFEAADPDHRIYARIGEAGRIAFPFSVGHRAGPTAPGTQRPSLSRVAAEAQHQADHLLLTRFAPPGVIVDERWEVLHFRGRTGEFLEQPPGQPQTNLLKLARGELLPELRQAVAQARERGAPVRVDGVQVSRGDRSRTISLEVLPLLAGREDADRCTLVLFHEAPREAPSSPVELEPGTAAAEIHRLQEELGAARQHLESMVEQHESSEDEYATVNEELIAANEELQSTNEELESAKEELQSANEELTTLNDELRSRNTDLDQLANDLTNIIEATDVPIVIVDADQRIRRFTPNVQGLFTLIPTDVGRPIGDVKLHFDVPDLARRIAEVLRRLQPLEWEVKDEGGRWFRLQIRPYHAGAREYDGAVLSFVTIDVLKRVIRDAEGARDYARAIVETVRMPLLVLDERRRLVSANPAFALAFGERATVREGEGALGALGDAAAAATLEQAASSALSGGRTERVEVQLELPGQGRRTFAVTARAAHAAGKRVVLFTFEDLTEHRHFEEERAARAAAEASNRTKDLFLATLSHELRTPLSTILMQAQVLQRGGADPKVERASGAIFRAASLQKRLIDDLLDVSRIVSGKLGLDQHVVDFGAIVEAAVEVVRTPAEEKRVALQATIEPGLSPVYADPSRMQQVVSNLLTNAVKFTPPGGSVSVTLERSGTDVRVTVRDTGTGIRREFLPQLFTRFTQADSSSTRTHGGLGLGLAIVKHVVDLHGGKVGADSEGEGRGSSIWVTLPRAQAPAQVPAPAAPQVHAGRITGLRVVVVEDDPGTRESVVAILGAAGAEVRGASSVAEGLTAIEELRPDVLLSDLAMPGQDGFALIGRVRALPPERGGRIPAAALSALVGVDDRRRALAAGFQLHVPKPVDADGLLAVVAELAQLRSQPSPG